MAKWDPNCSTKCSFCNVEEETYCHLFYTCAKTRELWTRIENSICCTGNNINITPVNVILNQISSNKKDVMNFICLLLKQYVYRCRCMREQLSFIQFKQHVIKIRSYEKLNASLSNKLVFHYQKWSKIDW